MALPSSPTRPAASPATAPSPPPAPLLLLLLLPLLALGAAVSGAGACSTDADCSLLGVCGPGGTCACDAGWRGADCGVLDLAPARRGSGYNRTGEAPPTSSWGGRVVRDPADAGLHHLFAAEFTRHCGLDYWSPMSRIIRAESRTGPAGPFAFAGEVVGTFAHNPTVDWSAAERQWLLFSIGCAVPQPASCEQPALECAPGNSNNGESGITLHTSPDLLSWTRAPGYVLANGSAGAWDEDTTNPSAYVQADGSVVLMYRGCPEGCASIEQLGFATAPAAAGPYARAHAQPILPNPLEDGFVWRDARGNWHFLAHSLEPGGGFGDGPKVGRHGFAADLHGQWTFGGAELAFNTTVRFDDGSSEDFYRRERPQLLFSEDGAMTPTFLVTGVQSVGSPNSFTLIQPVRGGAQ